MLPTSKDYLVSFFGVMMAGGIPVPIYPPARLAQIADHLKRHSRLLANAEAAMMITVHEVRPVAIMLQATVPSLAAIVTPADLQTGPQEPGSLFRPRADDIAFLQYTSGSTGDPKGVVLTHANLLANIRALGQASGVVPEDIFVSWLPLYHDMGLIGAWFGSLYHGIPLVLMSPLAFLAHPSLWLQTISRHRGTISGAPNFAYELCLRHVSDATLAELDLSSWRLAFNGAEPVSPATLEAFANRFAPCRLRRQALTPVYGLAESSVGLAFPPLGRGPRIDVIDKEAFAKEARAVPDNGQGKETLQMPSCGRALPGHAIRIVDETEFELPERHVGLLEFRGPSATSGYFHNPQATARLFHDGWLDSGDYAYMVEGEVFIAGREKDLIKRGGRNLYPYDLEEAAGKLPGIRKGCVAVFASTDSTSGKERLVIMAETRENEAGAQTTLRHALHQAALDIIGTPADDVVLVPPHTIPKTSSGKIRRIACRELYEHGQAAAHAISPRLQAIQFTAATGFAHVKLMLRHLRRLAYGGYAWAIFAMLALGAGGVIACLQRPRLGRQLARFAARLMFRLICADVTAKGWENLPPGPHVLLVNHASYLDAIALTALLPSQPGYAFTAKREFASQPLMRALLQGLGTLFIERVDIKQGLADVDAMSAALARGENLIVFPEGTFTRESGLKPFHAGAFFAAARARVPLVSGSLRGTRVALRDGSWMPHRTRIEFEIGKPIEAPADTWTDVMRATVVARQAMASLSGEFLLPD